MIISDQSISKWFWIISSYIKTIQIDRKEKLLSYTKNISSWTVIRVNEIQTK